MTTQPPVLVTGATGYVAGWIIKRLLEDGRDVHAAVRDPGNTARTQHLTEIAENAPGDITFYASDLLQEGSYAEAMAGCDLVFHTASPFTTQVKDPQKELIDPALLGTRNVLQTVNATQSVRRVVLTSSCTAIYTDAADCASAPGGMLTEEIWNTTASLDYQPYSYSKTLAEKEAWRIADAQSRWTLVVINPSLVIGPSLNEKPTSESFDIVKLFGDGTMRFGAPRLGLGVVDVRDVAEAHFQAGTRPDAAGRNIVSGPGTDLVRLAAMLQDRFGSDFPLPTRPLPKALLWAVAPIALKQPRRYISDNVDHEWKADNSKSRRELGIEYRSQGESINEMFQQMVDKGILA